MSGKATVDEKIDDSQCDQHDTGTFQDVTDDDPGIPKIAVQTKAESVANESPQTATLAVPAISIQGTETVAVTNGPSPSGDCTQTFTETGEDFNLLMQGFGVPFSLFQQTPRT